MDKHFVCDTIWSKRCLGLQLSERYLESMLSPSLSLLFSVIWDVTYILVAVGKNICNLSTSQQFTLFLQCDWASRLVIVIAQLFLTSPQITAISFKVQ